MDSQKRGALLLEDQNLISKSDYNKWVTLGIALLYALILMNLPFSSFKDRLNYINYATNSSAILSSYLARGVVDLLVNEPLWLLINIVLAFLLSPENVVRAIIFLSAFLFSYTFLRANPEKVIWLILFLLLPQVLKNYTTHLRQGLAISVFFVGYFSRKRIVRNSCLAAAPFIHASFFFVWVIILLECIGKKLHFAIDVRVVNAIISSIVLGISILPTIAWLGARQGYEYSFGTQMETGLGFIFWLCMLMLMIFQGKSYLDKYAIPTFGVIFYLGMYFFLPFAARVFESILPFVLLALLALTGWRKHFAMVALFVYFIFQWLFGFLRSGPMF